MTWIRCTQALLLITIATADASAQFLQPPVIIVQQPGIGFQYNSGRLRIAGFIPVMPYGPIGYPASNSRIVVQVVTPTVVSERLRAPRPDDAYDLAGIDLDVQPAAKIWGDKPALAKNPKEPPAKKAEAAKVAPPEPKKQVKPEVLLPPEPRVDRRPLGQRLIDDGIAAFRAGEYGVALLRFRQSEADPRALFLQAQASIAIGKYRHAAQLIQEGLVKNPQWPASGFRPKAELYANDEDVWKAHRKQLEQVQLNDPTDADLLFLLGYLAWFDGQRDIAVIYFQQSRAQAADRQWADLFLKAGKVN
jgi:tetratricopeptide (TPR) repeat protein